MREYQRVLMKLDVKRAIKEAGYRPMLVTLLYFLVTAAATWVVSLVFSIVSGSGAILAQLQYGIAEYDDFTYALRMVLLEHTPAQVLVALVSLVLCNVVCGLWAGIVNVGYRRFCLDMVHRRELRYDTLFSALPRSGGVVITQLLVGLFTVLWMLLFGAGVCVLALAAGLMMETVPGLSILLVLAAYVLFIWGCLWATLRYALVDFVIVDQDRTGLDAIRESKRLMRGNLRKLFVLQLSFLGWIFAAMGILYALMFVALFLGLMMGGGTMTAASAVMIGGVVLLWFPILFVLYLWLWPYMTGTYAHFYEWVRGSSSDFGPGGPGGWRQPLPPRSTTYTWHPNPGSGTGIGPGPQPGEKGPTPGEGWPGGPPKPPKSPKDDPWE